MGPIMQETSRPAADAMPLKAIGTNLADATHVFADKVFVLSLTMALIAMLILAIVIAAHLWFSIDGTLAPGAIVPLIIGVSLSLIVGGLVVGVFLYGRRQEIKLDGGV